MPVGVRIARLPRTAVVSLSAAPIAGPSSPDAARPPSSPAPGWRRSAPEPNPRGPSSSRVEVLQVTAGGDTTCSSTSQRPACPFRLRTPDGPTSGGGGTGAMLPLPSRCYLQPLTQWRSVSSGLDLEAFLRPFFVIFPLESPVASPGGRFTINCSSAQQSAAAPSIAKASPTLVKAVVCPD